TRRAGLHHPPAPARLLFSTAPRPPSPTLFPYTTLFRSRSPARHRAAVLLSDAVHNAGPDPRPLARRFPRLHVLLETDGEHDAPRSEEHTSELQSRENLVCRLLLEKKKERPQPEPKVPDP